MPAVPQENTEALDGDVWFRPLANKRHGAKAGRINHAAFKAFQTPPSGSAWKAELSGRLLSAAGEQQEIEDDARARADRQRAAALARKERGSEFMFVGLIYALATEVRRWQKMKATVIFVPDPPTMPNPDRAHAVLVATDLSPDEIRNNGSLLDFLQDAFTWLDPGQVAALVALKD